MAAKNVPAKPSTKVNTTAPTSGLTPEVMKPKAAKAKAEAVVAEKPAKGKAAKD